MEAIRADLDAQHTERLKKLENQFQQRSDTMKGQFNKKLLEGRNQREKMETEHKVALESIASSHQEEVAALEAKHQETLERVKNDEEARLQDSRQAWLADHPGPGNEVPATVKDEPKAPGSLEDWAPTEPEVKAFIDKNAMAKKIVIRNVIAKVDCQKEALIVKTKEEMAKIHANDLAKSKEEQDKVLDDRLAVARKKFDVDLDMATKKANVKASMAENRVRALQAKILVVEKAVEESPQKPVVEVWEVAKVAKPLAPPPPVTAKPTAPPVLGTSALPPTVPQQSKQEQKSPHVATADQSATSETSGPPSVVPDQATQGQQSSEPASVDQSASSSRVQSTSQMTLPPQKSQTQQPQLPGNFGRPTPAQSQARPPSAPGQQQQSDEISANSPQQARPPQKFPATSSPANSPPQQPRGSAQQQVQQRQNSQGQAQHNMSASPKAAQENQQVPTTHAATLRSLIHSGIPRGGGANRGRGATQALPQAPHLQNQQQGPRGGLAYNNQRGGGGRARGNIGRGAGGFQQQVQTTGLPQNQSRPQGSPSSAGGNSLNANARQFVPGGNKRPREDGAEGVDSGNGGKRVRGGGPSS